MEALLQICLHHDISQADFHPAVKLHAHLDRIQGMRRQNVSQASKGAANQIVDEDLIDVRVRGRPRRMMLRY